MEALCTRFGVRVGVTGDCDGQKSCPWPEDAIWDWANFPGGNNNIKQGLKIWGLVGVRIELRQK